MYMKRDHPLDDIVNFLSYGFTKDILIDQMRKIPRGYNLVSVAILGLLIFWLSDTICTNLFASTLFLTNKMLMVTS